MVLSLSLQPVCPPELWEWLLPIPYPVPLGGLLAVSVHPSLSLKHRPDACCSSSHLVPWPPLLPPYYPDSLPPAASAHSLLEPALHHPAHLGPALLVVRSQGPGLGDSVESPARGCPWSASKVLSGEHYGLVQPMLASFLHVTSPRLEAAELASEPERRGSAFSRSSLLLFGQRFVGAGGRQGAQLGGSWVSQ